MKVVVDTCIWSHVLRSNAAKEQRIVNTLTELIRDVRVQLIGPIRQEILSGIKSEEQFIELKDFFMAFTDLPIDTADYEKAAEFYNTCRKNGIQGSNTDFLICAVAFHNDLEIFTSDSDFTYFQKHIPLKLFEIKNI